MSLTTLPEHFQTDFADNWEHLVQQGDSRLGDCVRRISVQGKERTLSQIGTSAMSLITNRNGKTVASDSTFAKRWLRPKGYEKVTHIDEFDDLSLGELSAPESEHVQSHAMAYNRQVDQVLIDASVGTAYTGEDGTTATALPSSQKVAVDYVKTGSAANSGLTLAKLLRTKMILDENEVPDGDRYIAVSAQQLFDLLNDVNEVKSSDYNNVKALVDGKVTMFAGFHFKRTELLALNTTTDVRTCFAWHRGGLALGVGVEKKVKISVRDDLSESIQIRTVANLGATRVEEERVVEILCDESP
jgi:hypothetical protein